MKGLLKLALFMVLFLAACQTNVVQQDVEQRDAAQLFLAMTDDAEYTERHFLGPEAEFMADLVQAECPQGVEGDFVRAVYKSHAASLILYTSTDGKTIWCEIFRPEQEKQLEYKTRAEAPASEVALTVNGYEITIEQVNAQLDALPEDTPRDENALGVILNSLVNNELVRQQAAAMDVSEQEVDVARNAFMQQAGINSSALSTLLNRQGVSIAQFEGQMTEQAKLQKLFRERLLIENIDVTDETAREYYLGNTNQFLQSEQAVMRQIFISSGERTEEQVLALAQQVASLLNSTDFCGLVKEFSDDKSQECGVYVVPRGVINSDLEHAVFNTPRNRTSVVRTDAGMHFVQTLQVNPAQVVPYDQVATQLRSSLVNTVFQQRLSMYISMLRANADIVVYLG